MQFKCKGMTVSIGFPFAAAVTLMFLYDTSGTAAVSLCAALLHEMGHLLCLFWYGETPQALKLGLSGVEIVRAKGQRLTFAQEITAALAGPLVNLALFLLLAALSGWGRNMRMMEAASVNLVLALFNLLPVAALDGGRALYFFLCRFCAMQTAQRIVTALSAICLLPCAFLGFYLLLHSGYNFSLLLVTVYLCFLLAVRPGQE